MLSVLKTEGTASIRCHADTQFDCGGGLCISLDKVCDGVDDCGQWEDEPKGKCNVDECALNNGGCMHTCTDTTWGFRCGCHAGYTLSDNSTCIGSYISDICTIDHWQHNPFMYSGSFIFLVFLLLSRHAFSFTLTHTHTKNGGQKRCGRVSGTGYVLAGVYQRKRHLQM